MNKIGKLIATYDECQILTEEVEYRVANKEDYDYEFNTTKEQIETDVYENEDLLTDRYYDVCYTVGEVFSRKFETMCAKVMGENLNWRGSSGHKYICLEQFNNVSDFANIGRMLISSLFSEGEFTLTCYNYGKGLYFKISHHDCPTGSFFYLTPCARSTYEANS